jgi:hypothetical protein
MVRMMSWLLDPRLNRQRSGFPISQSDIFVKIATRFSAYYTRKNKAVVVDPVAPQCERMSIPTYDLGLKSFLR